MGEKKSQAAGKTLQKNENSAIISDNSAADGRGASRMKRENYITWDEYFMGVAMLAARRSKDPNTQVGACIVSPDNIIISTGYNGLPNGCSDDEYPWEREGEETKYPYVVHAELNAILNANGRDLRGSRLYVALFPCNECAKAIIQAGVKEVLYLSDKYASTAATRASKRMLDSAGVTYRQLHPSTKEIVLDLAEE
jgi:cytidine and deoxycytidylate deaminase zinc-binding region